jgi:hypothetical protein
VDARCAAPATCTDRWGPQRRNHLWGAPAGPLESWPRRADGVPLALLLQVDLDTVDDYGDLGIQERLGAVRGGVLQVFHDGESFGADPVDAGCWLVRHVPQPAEPVAMPDDLDADWARPAQPVRWAAFQTVTATGALTPEQADAVEKAHRRLAEAERQSAHGVTDPPDPRTSRRPTTRPGAATRCCSAHPRCPKRPGTRCSTRYCPVRRGDDRRLLVDIPSVGPFDGCFGDGARLEIWVRRSDLAHGRLDRAWAVVVS